MRKCLRCNAEMVSGLDLKVEGGAVGLKVTQEGIFKDSLGRVECAVCPECGWIEVYLSDPSKVRKLAEKREQQQA